jgi:hypothetical protein
MYSTSFYLAIAAQRPVVILPRQKDKDFVLVR